VVDISACIHPDHHASVRVAARAGLTATSEIIDDEVVWRLQTPTLAGMPEVEPVPERLHTVTPRLVFGGDAAVAMRFYVDAFGAEVVEEPFVDPDGRVVHAEIRIGDSVVFVTDEGADGNGVAPATVGGRVTAVMALNIADVDQLWERAVAAGCEVIYPLADQFYGDRGGRLRDPYGHQWMLSTHIEDVNRDELERRMGGDAGG
jgi:PhnB protein